MLALLLASIIGVASPLPQASDCAAATAFTGTICTPKAVERHPAILLLGGSEGGDMMRFAAARFAGAGYVAASVAYFGAPGLPSQLAGIPVETVGTALDDIAKRPDVDPARIALFGISKGGELALLAASTYPQFKAVVAAVSSPFAWEGIPRGPGAVGSSWTFAGKPVPFVAYGSKMAQLTMNAYANQTPLDLRVGYEASMQEHAAEIPAAMFHLERIAGPVMMLAADDDQLWNSDVQSQLGMTYLRDRHHAFADVYEHYADAGHLFLFASPEQTVNHVKAGPMTLLMGGTPAGDQAAQRAAWPEVMRFLATALKSRGG